MPSHRQPAPVAPACAQNATQQTDQSCYLLSFSLYLPLFLSLPISLSSLLSLSLSGALSLVLSASSMFAPPRTPLTPQPARISLSLSPTPSLMTLSLFPALLSLSSFSAVPDIRSTRALTGSQVVERWPRDCRSSCFGTQVVERWLRACHLSPPPDGPDERSQVPLSSARQAVQSDVGREARPPRPTVANACVADRRRPFSCRPL